MITTLHAPGPHADNPDCWCHPEIVPMGERGGIALAKLEHNDLLGWHFGLYAATRLYDSRLHGVEQ